MNNSIAKNVDFANKAQFYFRESGISVAEWARAKGFSTGLVYQVLDGKRKCVRGQSHDIAVALGLKEGTTMSLNQLDFHLSRRRAQ